MQFTTNLDTTQLTADLPPRQLQNKKAARCQSAAIPTKTFSLEAVSHVKEKNRRLSHVNNNIRFNRQT